MKRKIDEFPQITRSIWDLIQSDCGGNVKSFAEKIGTNSYSIVQRLFLKDKRNGKYPTPSTNIISMIVKAYPDFSVTDVLTETKSVNNININKGNNNIIGNGNNKDQEDKIDKLIKQNELLINLLIDKVLKP